MTAPSELRETSGHRCEHPRRDVGLAEWVCPSKSCRRVWMYRGFGGWWMTGEVAAAEPNPPAEIPARLARDEEIPTRAWTLAADAKRYGWAVNVMYARGTLGGLRSARIVDSITVCMRRGGTVAYGIWYDGKFSSGVLFGAALGRLNLAELKAAVSRTPGGEPS